MVELVVDGSLSPPLPEPVGVGSLSSGQIEFYLRQVRFIKNNANYKKITHPTVQFDNPGKDNYDDVTFEAKEEGLLVGLSNETKENTDWVQVAKIYPNFGGVGSSAASLVINTSTSKTEGTIDLY